MSVERQTRVVYGAAALLVALSGCEGRTAGEAIAAAGASPPPPEIVPATVAIAAASLPRIDPEPLDEAEIGEVLGAGPSCRFAYTDEGGPVFAHGSADDAARQGVVKIHGRLVALSSAPGEPAKGETSYGTDGLRVSLAADDGIGARALGRWNATMRFAVLRHEAPVLEVGYAGWYRCRDG